MTILLLITADQRSLVEIATTERIGEEIVRTFVGEIWLVLAVPITTAFAVITAPKGATMRDAKSDVEPAGLGSHKEGPNVDLQ